MTEQNSADRIILTAKNLSKVYRTLADEVVVFSGLNVEISSGTAVALIGQSGRGKTTLLNLLSGLDRPSGGEIDYQGMRIDSLDEDGLSDFRNRHIGFVFQHHYLLEDFTALENVLLPLRIQGLRITSKETDQASSLLSGFGLSGREKHFPDQLSGGERQRVAIARALIHNPSIIFADEPTGSLDRKNALVVEELLWKLKENFNKTLVLATHNLEIAKKCDKMIDLG